jgi:hypothetical protein
VVAFLTKPMEDQAGGLAPLISAKVRLPGEGGTVGRDFPVDPAAFCAAADRCDIQAGPNRCQQIGVSRYRLTLHLGEIDGTIEVEGLVPPARIGTGHLLFESGSAMVKLVVGGQTVEGPGAAYHDHNWGDGPMALPLHHWYWGRAVVGTEFVVIAADTVVQPAYGATHHTDLILIRNGTIIKLGNAGVSFQEGLVGTDVDTKKPVADVTSYSFSDAGIHYLATFTRSRTALTRFVGGAAYHRFTGVFSLQVVDDPTASLHASRHTTWELMWFGDAPAPTSLGLYARMLGEPVAL